MNVNHYEYNAAAAAAADNGGGGGGVQCEMD
jgi:hypothetical protein